MDIVREIYKPTTSLVCTTLRSCATCSDRWCLVYGNPLPEISQFQVSSLGMAQILPGLHVGVFFFLVGCLIFSRLNGGMSIQLCLNDFVVPGIDRPGPWYHICDRGNPIEQQAFVYDTSHPLSRFPSFPWKSTSLCIKIAYKFGSLERNMYDMRSLPRRSAETSENLEKSMAISRPRFSAQVFGFEFEHGASMANPWPDDHLVVWNVFYFP